MTAFPTGLFFSLLHFASPAVVICFVFQRYPAFPEDLTRV
jgi:hypothetical protein